MVKRAGFWAKSHDPFALMADPSKADFKVPDLLPPAEIGKVRLERRKKLREIVDGTFQEIEASDDARLLNENFHTAYRLMTSKQAREAFDLTKEKPGDSRALWNESFRSMLPVGASADRSWSPVRHDQYVLDGI